MKTVHEVDPGFKSVGKRQLLVCKKCNTETLHVTAFFGYPFQCVAGHGRTSLCDGCKTYVSQIAKVVVDKEGKHKQFCELCCAPDSLEKRRLIEARQQQVAEDAKKPIDLNDPESIARALGASSFSKR